RGLHRPRARGRPDIGDRRRARAGHRPRARPGSGTGPLPHGRRLRHVDLEGPGPPLAQRPDRRDAQPDLLPRPRAGRLLDQRHPPGGSQRDRRRAADDAQRGRVDGVRPDPDRRRRMTAATATSATAASSPQGLFAGKKRVLASAFAGTTIEWYDFYLYGTAAALVFNVQFFPTGTQLGSTLASFASLAVGFFARPVGGIIAGHLGDRIGRKALLVASLMAMGIAS